MKPAIIMALIGACTGSINLPGGHTTTAPTLAAATTSTTTPAGTTPAAASASQAEPTNDPHLGPQALGDPADPVDPLDDKDLDQLEGVKLEDAKATVRSWSRDVRIEIMIVDHEYSPRRDTIVRCFEGVVCEAHRDHSSEDDPVILEVGPKPEVGAAPPPP